MRDDTIETFSVEPSPRVGLWGVTAAFAILTLQGFCAAASDTVKTIRAEAGNITFQVPGNFSALTRAEVDRRLPNQSSLLAGLGDPERSVVVAYMLKAFPLRPEQLRILKSDLMTMVTKGTTNQWVKSDDIQINGTRWISGEYIKRDPGGDMHFIELFTSYHGFAFDVAFTAPESAFDACQDRIWSCVHSLSVKDAGGTAAVGPCADEDMALGEVAGHQGRLDDAQKDFTAARTAQPGLASALVSLGNLDLRREADLEAIKFFSDALALDPDSPVALERRSIAERNLGDFKSALDDINRTIELKPKSPRGFVLRAHTELSQGDASRAGEDYQRALALAPNDLGALNGIGWMKMEQGDPDAAILSFKTVLSVRRNDEESMDGMGEVNFLQGHLIEALQDFHATVEMAPTDDDVQDDRLFIWMIQSLQGQAPEADAELADFIKDAATFKHEWIKQVGAYLLGQKSSDDLLAFAPTDDAYMSRHQRCRVWYYIGMKNVIDGNTDSAEKAFRQCVACDMKSVDYTYLAKARLPKSFASQLREAWANSGGGSAPPRSLAYILGYFAGVTTFYLFFTAMVVGIALLVRKPSASRAPAAPAPSPIQRPPPMR